MTRSTSLLLTLALLLSFTTTLLAADPKRTSPGPIAGLPYKIVKLENGTLTVRPAMTFADPSKTPPEETLKIDPKQTKVFLHEITGQREDERGRIITQTKIKPGALTDLKVGQQVNVGLEDDVAVDIVIRSEPTRK